MSSPHQTNLANIRQHKSLGGDQAAIPTMTLRWPLTHLEDTKRNGVLATKDHFINLSTAPTGWPARGAAVGEP